MKTKLLLTLIITTILFGCSETTQHNEDHTTPTNDTNMVSEIKIVEDTVISVQTLNDSISTDTTLSYWETVDNEYPLLYVNMYEQGNLSEPLKQYAEKIIDAKGDFNRIDEVLSFFNELDLNQDQIDSAFFMYVDFLETINAYDEEVFCYEKDGLAILEDKYQPYGYSIFCEEGETYLSPNLYEVAKQFNNNLSPDLYAFVEVYHINDNPQLTNDGGLVVSWKDYGDYVLKLEEVVTSNEKNKYLKYLLHTYKIHLDLLLWGLDNTPTIDTWGDHPNKLEPEVEEMYNHMMNDKTHYTGSIITKHIEKLEESNYNFDWNTRWKPNISEIKYFLELE